MIPLCACGCGGPVTVTAKGPATWLRGHSSRIRPPCSWPRLAVNPKRAKIGPLSQPCACGCGLPTNVKGDRPFLFVKGHSARKHKEGELRDAKTAHAFSSLNRKYGLTRDGYYALVTAQGDRCAICLAGDKGRCRGGAASRWAVDHNHRTGAIRGLLCHNCNKGLGNLKDSAYVVARAIQYLEDGGFLG